MTRLLSSPSTYASWSWEVDDKSADPNHRAIRAIFEVVGVLKERKLLDPSQARVTWLRKGHGTVGIQSIVWIHEGEYNAPDDLLGKIAESRPIGHPELGISHIEIDGPGEWIDEEGSAHRERQLIWVSVLPSRLGPIVELRLHHDIWSYYNFSGVPHPEVYHYNAHRLAEALESIEEALGAETDEGEMTIYANPGKYGIVVPEADSEGSGPDVSGYL